MPDIGTSGAIIPSWVQKLVTNGNGGQMNSVSVDSSGNVYVCGSYFASNSFTFAGATLPSSLFPNWPNGFFAKLDASGSLQWIKVLKSNSLLVRCNKIKVDGDYLFVVGEYESNSPINLDTDASVGSTLQLPTSTGIDGFMMSVSKATGNALWTARVGGGNADVQMGIDTDSTNVYFTGSYSGAITFNASVSLPPPYFAYDGCVIAFQKSNGTVLWAKRISGGGYEVAYSVVVYDTSVYVATHYIASSDITLQNSPQIILPATTNVNTSAPLLLKMNKSTGEITWVRHFQTTRDLSIAYTVAADATGVYLGGNYCRTSSLTIDNNVVIPASESNIANNNTGFVLKYNHSGVPQWIKTINTSSGYNNVSALISSEGYVYICGQYLSTSGPASFNSLVTLPQNSTTSAFIFCCNSDGYPIWTDVMINSINTQTYDLAKASDGILVASRHAGFGVTIGNGVIPPSTGSTASPMVTKYIVQNPVVTDTNAVTVMTDAAAIASNSLAAANIQTITAQVVEANILQKIADTQAVALIGKVSSVPTTVSATPIVESTDNTVAVKAYTPPTGGASAVSSVSIAVSRITDLALLELSLPPGPKPEELTQISVRKFDAAGQPIESTIGDKTTYDKVTVKFSTVTTSEFQFVHVSNAGTRTTLSASVNIATATLNQAIALDGAADATVKVLSRSATEADIELFVPFSSVQGSATTTPCFTAGTKILTPTGYKLVEELKTGDSVMTADGRSVMANVYQRELSRTSRLNAPYHIPAYTLGKRQPKDLTLSPLHAVQIKKGVWEIPADAAHRYPQIKQVGVGEPVTYYHIETSNYFRDNLVANGAVVESFCGNQKNRIPANRYLYSYSKVHGGYVRYEPATTRSLTK